MFFYIGAFYSRLHGMKNFHCQVPIIAYIHFNPILVKRCLIGNHNTSLILDASNTFPSCSFLQTTTDNFFLFSIYAQISKFNKSKFQFCFHKINWRSFESSFLKCLIVSVVLSFVRIPCFLMNVIKGF